MYTNTSKRQENKDCNTFKEEKKQAGIRRSIIPLLMLDDIDEVKV